MLRHLKSRFSLNETPKEWMPDLGVDVPEVVVAVMGMTGSGKSSLIKAVTGREDIVVGHSLHSTTSQVGSYRCCIEGINFVLVDTPGFNDTFRNEKDILQEITSWLSKTYAGGKRLNGLIYLHPIVSTRVEGSSLLSLQMFRKLCGPQCYDHIFLCTTFWDIVEVKVAERREKELCESADLWGHMKSQGAKVFHISDYKQSKSMLLELAKKPPIVLDVQRELVEKSLPVESTSAGRLIDQENQRLKEELNQQARAAKEDAVKKLADRDAAHAQNLKKEQERFEKLRQQQARLLEDQRRQNEKLQKEIQEAAELRAKEERQKKDRLEAEARKRLRAQAEEKRRLKEEEEAHQARQAEEITRLQEKSKRQVRSQQLRLTWQVQIRELERAQSMWLIRAQMYRLESQAPAFIRACDFCRRLIGFQSFYSCVKCDVDVCQRCTTTHGLSRVGFESSHAVIFDPNPPPRKCCRRLNPNCVDSQYGGITCSFCRQPCEGLCFHCCDCDSENFDLCLKCVTTRGATCYNFQHILHPMFAPLS